MTLCKQSPPFSGCRVHHARTAADKKLPVRSRNGPGRPRSRNRGAFARYRYTRPVMAGKQPPSSHCTPTPGPVRTRREHLVARLADEAASHRVCPTGKPCMNQYYRNRNNGHQPGGNISARFLLLLEFARARPRIDRIWAVHRRPRGAFAAVVSRFSAPRREFRETTIRSR